MSHGHSRPKSLIISSTALTSCCRPPLPFPPQHPSPTPPASATWPVVLQENRRRLFAWRRPDVSRSRCRKRPRQRRLAYVSQRLIAFSFSAALLSKIAVKKKKKKVCFVCCCFFLFPSSSLYSSSMERARQILSIVFGPFVVLHQHLPHLPSPPLPSQTSALLFIPRPPPHPFPLLVSSVCLFCLIAKLTRSDTFL